HEMVTTDWEAHDDSCSAYEKTEQPVVGVDVSHGKDYSARVESHTESGKLVIDRVVYGQPKPASPPVERPKDGLGMLLAKAEREREQPNPTLEGLHWQVVHYDQGEAVWADDMLKCLKDLRTAAQDHENRIAELEGKRG
ncbi:MAG: hypothetical protein Q8P12_02065, partial [bacterium]|nr:hypothetical protein [bacterium]